MITIGYFENKSGIEFQGQRAGERPFYQQFFNATLEMTAKTAPFLRLF